jgi:type II secretion system protein I
MGANARYEGTRKALRRAGRDGFSLLEIILALAILCGAIATLGELSRLGMRQAERARDLTQAQLLCESKLNEIVAGLTPLEAQDGVPFESTEDQAESEWLYSIEVASVAEDGLAQVRVTVTKDMPSGRRAVEFSLVRWVMDEGEAL